MFSKCPDRIPYHSPNLEANRIPFDPDLKVNLIPYCKPDLEANRIPYREPNLEANRISYREPDLEANRITYRAPFVDTQSFPCVPANSKSYFCFGVVKYDDGSGYC